MDYKEDNKTSYFSQTTLLKKVSVGEAHRNKKNSSVIRVKRQRNINKSSDDKEKRERTLECDWNRINKMK